MIWQEYHFLIKSLLLLLKEETSILSQNPSLIEFFYPKEPIKGSFKLEKQPIKTSEDPFSLLKTTLKEIAPKLALKSTIPLDQKAKQIRFGWKIPDVPILIDENFKEDIPFLQKIANAIQKDLAPSQLVDIKRIGNGDLFSSLKHIKLIVIPQALNLKLQLEKKISIPILVLSPLSFYKKDPSLKRDLWKSLCQKLSPR